MRLDDLAAGIGEIAPSSGGAAEISSLSHRADGASPGSLHFCVRGFTADGHEFASEALRNGAAALVVDHALGLDAPEVHVRDVRGAMAPLAARFHGDPTAVLDVCGITGTNGKTTTAFLVRELLEAAGRPTGLLGTVKQIVGGVEEPAERTTPEAIELQETFARMRDAGDVACAAEVSSHALELGRVDCVRFACAVFTNLTQDHLDFHPDMEAYFAAKRRLFDGAPDHAVINVDDEYGRRLAHGGALTYSAQGDPAADFRAADVEFDAAGARFRCITPEGEMLASTRLPGHFNVANALAALAAVCAMGVPAADAVAALASAGRVPGRFEPVEAGQDFGVYVDYAHTPDSLDNVLAAARRLTDGEVICVFGCGGDRDRGKRPLMGAAAAEGADLAVVTSDNPRGEDAEAIIAEVLTGMEGGDPVVEPDRRNAIRIALGRARPGDVVVIAGKGHEQGQELAGGKRIPFDDREVAAEELRDLAPDGAP